MNTRLLRRFLRYEMYAARRCFEILSDRPNERRLLRDVRLIHGDHDIPFPFVSYTPKPIGDWPGRRGQKPLTEVCRETYEAVAEQLTAAKPSNVKQLRGART